MSSQYLFKDKEQMLDNMIAVITSAKKLLQQAVSVLYMQRYLTGTFLRHQLFQSEMLTIIEQKARTAPAGAGAGSGGAVSGSLVGRLLRGFP